MATLFLKSPAKPMVTRPLTQADAVNIWIARWLRVRPSELVRRYGCNPRRLYEIWKEARFPGSRSTALQLFRQRYPGLDERIDPGPHAASPSKITLTSSACLKTPENQRVLLRGTIKEHF